MDRKKTHKSAFIQYNNRKHKILAPEEMSLEQWYTFTYNPETQPRRPNMMIDLISWHNGMDHKFKRKYCQIEAVPEISSNGRFHYHGLIKITNIMKFYIEDLPVLRDGATYEIDTISDMTAWKTYMYKQQYLMEPLTKEYGIPYTYYSHKIMKVKTTPLQNVHFEELIKYKLEDINPDSEDGPEE